MNLSSQQKLIIAGIVAFLIVVIAVVVLVVPQFGAISDLDAQIEQAQQDIGTAQTLLERRQAVKARAAQTEAELLRLYNQVPETPELPSLVIELQDVANASGLEFVRLEPIEPVRGDPENSEESEAALYETTLIRMYVDGTWQDTVDLLQRLRRVSRQLRIDNLEVSYVEPSSLEETSTVELVSAVITMEAYTVSAEDAASGSTTGTAPPPPVAGE